MRNGLLVLGFITVMLPSLLYGQQSFVEYEEGDTLEQILKIFPFLSIEDNLVKIPNIVNKKKILANYKNYHNKSDTIIIEQVLYAVRWQNLSIFFGNLFGLKRSMVVAFDIDENDSRIIYSKEDNYIEGFKKIRADSLLFFLFKTKNSTNCSEEKTFSVFLFNSKNGFFDRAFNELSDIEYFENEPFCRNGISYQTEYALDSTKNKKQKSLYTVRKISGKELMKKYKFRNNKFVL